MPALYIIIFILSIGYLTYIIVERIILTKLRSSFKYIIHVNGIRGKSTTTRLIDAGMRECGFKVFSKTTGTVPTYINTKNEDVVIKRLGSANIKEQIKMLLKAKKEGAEVVVLECMAVNPELQRICEEKILKADVCVITNVRMDHIGEMGDNLDELALALSSTIPTNGKLVINESNYVDFFKDKASKKGTEVIVAKPYVGDNLETFEENIAVSMAVCEALGLDSNTFFEGLKNYHHDIGAFKAYDYNGITFLNGFSINDPESIKLVFDRICETYNKDEMVLLLNNRFDRPTRVNQHIELVSNIGLNKVYIMGSNKRYVMNKLLKNNPNLDVKMVNKIEDLNDEKIIFAIGNIGGGGLKILNYVQNNGGR